MSTAQYRAGDQRVDPAVPATQGRLLSATLLQQQRPRVQQPHFLLKTDPEHFWSTVGRGRLRVPESVPEKSSAHRQTVQDEAARIDLERTEIMINRPLFRLGFGRALLATVLWPMVLMSAGAAGEKPVRADAAYPEWKHAGSIWLLTTPDGANLPAEAKVEQFPVLVRLQRDFFDFAEAQPGGADVRFSSSHGERLAYQIEEWDVARGVASIWVRVPVIKGNARQELKIYWGNSTAQSESNAASYGVLHV